MKKIVNSRLWLNETLKLHLNKLFKPESNQARGSFAIYYTRKYNIEYCDELGTKLLGILNIDLLDSVHLDNGSINFELTFGQYEIIASARNENGQEHMTTFCYPADDDF
ncbi:unnamed protein product [Rhizophagus irregularis]|nr:unnamed protein product [Rhizophagus irregularis]